MEKRALCSTCKSKPVAVNYHKNGKTFYRTKCDSCIRKEKKHTVGLTPFKIKADL